MKFTGYWRHSFEDSFSKHLIYPSTSQTIELCSIIETNNFLMLDGKSSTARWRKRDFYIDNISNILYSTPHAGNEPRGTQSAK